MIKMTVEFKLIRNEICPVTFKSRYVIEEFESKISYQTVDEFVKKLEVELFKFKNHYSLYNDEIHSIQISTDYFENRCPRIRIEYPYKEVTSSTARDFMNNLVSHGNNDLEDL